MEGPSIAGMPVESVLCGVVLAGVTLFRHHTLRAGGVVLPLVFG